MALDVVGPDFAPSGPAFFSSADKRAVDAFRPHHFRGAARDIFNAGGTENPREEFAGPDDPLKEQTVWQAKFSFTGRRNPAPGQTR